MRLLAAGLLLFPVAAFAQLPADPALLEEIRSIRAVDNHSHLLLEGTATAALPADGSLGVTPFERGAGWSASILDAVSIETALVNMPGLGETASNRFRWVPTANSLMLIKPNVYADFSAQTFLRSPRALSETLRAWLEWYPEKVLFGSDAYPDPNTPLSGWEEMLWLANDSARQALAIALTGMMHDGEITRVRAVEIARMVLRDNARSLYRLDARPAR